MSIITVYKSDADGKIFEDKSKYTAHLRKLARHRNTQRRLQVAKDFADQRWAKLYEREQSIVDWACMVINNQDMFWAEAAEGNRYDWDRVGKAKHKGVLMPIPRLLEFTQFNLNWSDHVSNSHNCPHNGVENFNQSYNRKLGKNLPESYPGWTGRVEWIVAWPKEWEGFYLGSQLFAKGSFRSGRQRAHTGSGGGGGMRYSEKHGCHVMSFGYDFRIFAADWPGMARYYEKKKMWNELKRA